MARFGAYDPKFKGHPGYEVIPTLYLLGPDGTVRWCDRQARFRHVEKERILKDIDAAITKALDESAASKGK